MRRMNKGFWGGRVARHLSFALPPLAMACSSAPPAPALPAASTPPPPPASSAPPPDPLAGPPGVGAWAPLTPDEPLSSVKPARRLMARFSRGVVLIEDFSTNKDRL